MCSGYLNQIRTMRARTPCSSRIFHPHSQRKQRHKRDVDAMSNIVRLMPARSPNSTAKMRQYQITNKLMCCWGSTSIRKSDGKPPPKRKDLWKPILTHLHTPEIHYSPNDTESDFDIHLTSRWPLEGIRFKFQFIFQRANHIHNIFLCPEHRLLADICTACGKCDQLALHSRVLCRRTWNKMSIFEVGRNLISSGSAKSTKYGRKGQIQTLNWYQIMSTL